MQDFHSAILVVDTPVDTEFAYGMLQAGRNTQGVVP
jgi:hypothetical protein